MSTDTIIISNEESIIDELRVLVRRENYATRDSLRISRSLSCYVNQFISPPGLPKGEFKKAMKHSDSCINKYKKTGDPGELPVEILVDVGESIDCIRQFDARRKELTKLIEKCAKKLHVYPWWESIHGLGAKSLGLIVGNAGNIGTFNKAAGLWQRMGLRNVKFKACSTWAKFEKDNKLSANEWVDIGYCPRRRAVMFAIVSALLQHQRQVKDKELERPQRWRANGDYGKLAISRYKETIKTHPDWRPIHREFDINRVVGKRLLADLLKQWKS